jgi:hypothetical protein
LASGNQRRYANWTIRIIEGQMKMLRFFTILVTIFILPNVSNAAEGKGIRFWNLTAATITSLQLSPAGKSEWGQNQTDNDKDHSVDHDERLKIAGIEPGIYDVKFRDNLHRECVIKKIDIKADGIFSIEEKKLVGFCHMF